MIAMLVLCVLFWKLPAVSFALYPFKLFVTMVHESAHALAALVTGGSVASVSIAPDESGLTCSSGGFRPLVASAGYMGTSLFGGLMIWLGRKPEAARTVLFVLGGTLLVLTILFGRGEAFSVISMALISLGILLVAKRASIQLTHLFLMMLAVICAIEAVIDFQTLLQIAVIPDAASDARTMAMLTHIPRTIWTLFFGLFSMTVLFLSFWISYRSTAPNEEPGKVLESQPTSG